MANAGEDEKKITHFHFWWEYKLEHPVWKLVWQLPRKLRIDVPQYPAIPS